MKIILFEKNKGSTLSKKELSQFEERSSLSHSAAGHIEKFQRQQEERYRRGH
jgi:hypothetical protein